MTLGKSTTRQVEVSYGLCSMRHIVFPPTVRWMGAFKQRPHHLARVFGRLCGNVSYCDPTFAQGLHHSEETGVSIIGGRGLDCKKHIHSLKNPIVWTFPYNYHYVLECERCEVVYDLIDHLSIFSTYGSLIERNFEKARQKANYVTYVARSLAASVDGFEGKKLYLPNAADVDLFSADEFSSTQAMQDVQVENDVQKLLQLRRYGKRIAGYYGSLASWFDTEAVRQVAESRSDWVFILIGKKYPEFPFREEELLHLPNVIFLGERKYEQLPRYLKHFDVAIIPFLINNITVATNPLKVFEYFAGSKNVIASRMPELIPLSPPLFLYDISLTFEVQLDTAYSRRAANKEVIRELANQNSWINRALEFLHALEKPKLV